MSQYVKRLKLGDVTATVAVETPPQTARRVRCKMRREADTLASIARDRYADLVLDGLEEPTQADIDALNRLVDRRIPR